jgi:Bifunctional DNA primase/polymerase, N-terminal
MMAAFADAAPAWAAAGIVPLPITPDGKKTMVKHPEAFGRPAAMGLAAKPRYAAANLGFMCGAFNRLTVVDVDSPADAELQHVLATYGDSPIIVSTPSGGRHVYYAHNDEPRRVRLDERHPIDMLGSGLCVAPPSVRPSGASYAWLRGGLSDIANGNLPRIREGALQKLEPALSQARPPRSVLGQPATIEQGERNARFLRLTCALALHAKTKADLLEQSREANAAMCKPPLSDAEVLGAVGSAWRYKEQGTLMVPGMESAIIFPRASLSHLLASGEIDAWALLGLFQSSHGVTPGKLFAASPAAMERDRCIGRWDRHRYRNAIRKLCDLGELEQVYSGGKGPHDPAMYRLRPLAKGGKSPPNTNQILPPLSPCLRARNHKRHFRVLAKEQRSRLGQHQNMRRRGELR